MHLTSTRLRTIAIGLTLCIAAPIVMLGLSACGDSAVLLLWPLADYVINRNRQDRTSRYIYTVVAETADGPPIAGAVIELFPLAIGGDPDNEQDYDSPADAVRMTNQDGEAEIRVLASPNVPGDNVIRPGTIYKEQISAPGFRTYVSIGQRGPIELGQGPIELPPIVLLPSASP